MSVLHMFHALKWMFYTWILKMGANPIPPSISQQFLVKICDTCVKEVLSDILLFLAEATVMGGHAG